MRLLIGSIAVLAIAFASGSVHAGSSRCNGGTSTPAGINVRNSGEPTGGSGWLAVCNDGSVVPAPAKGSAEIGGNLDEETGYVEVDGDSDNAGASCTDGFFRIEMSGSEGVEFFNGPDGNAADTNPNAPGAQPAQPKTADEFATSTIEDCQ